MHLPCWNYFFFAAAFFAVFFAAFLFAIACSPYRSSIELQRNVAANEGIDFMKKSVKKNRVLTKVFFMMIPLWCLADDVVLWTISRRHEARRVPCLRVRRVMVHAVLGKTYTSRRVSDGLCV
jgi:hypothetical protein